MKYKSGDIVKISGVYREISDDGLVVSELICLKNELFPQTSHITNCYEIKMIADGCDVNVDEE